MSEKVNKQDHIKQHEELHQNLDLLVADFIRCTEKILSNITVLQLMEWSHQQTINPVLPTGYEHEEN